MARHNKQSGFTLVEMLVVVAIMLLLITILTPELERGIDMQRMVYCQFNCKNIGLATMSYTLENQLRLPGPNWRLDKAHGWLYYDLQMDKPEDCQTGQLWEYLLDASVYRCPADRTKPDTVPGRPNNSRMMTSYCSNGSWIKWGQGTWDPNPPTYPRKLIRNMSGYDEVVYQDIEVEPGKYDGYWKTYKVSQFKENDILYWEADELKSGGWWHDGSNFPWEGVTRRHIYIKNDKDGAATNAEAQYNYGYTSAINADGSCEWLSIKDYYAEVYTDWLAGSGVTNNKTRLWNVPNTDNGR
ncbi:MAG: prepilin-type N-terminal cleavage/methylation domain-containing protein [Phycisphaera sp.]|nr:prepilin-type N-terminal cleavage/methylation domain-containing protein [Phycisphaera sp.]